MTGWKEMSSNRESFGDTGIDWAEAVTEADNWLASASSGTTTAATAAKAPSQSAASFIVAGGCHEAAVDAAPVDVHPYGKSHTNSVVQQ